ncbi:MAG: carboxymuconolactone decarboxylase family protein, partial [Bacteroidota bacterium]
MASQSYPELNKEVNQLLQKCAKESPDVMEGFMKMHEATSKDGALSGKIKELIALAIGITVRCDGCIAFHVHDAMKAGATREEIAETVGVSILMGGGPSVVYGSQALKALEQFEKVGLD